MQSFQKDPAKFLFISDFEYYCTESNLARNKAFRVLGKLELFTTKKRLAKIICEHSDLTKRDFWKQVFSSDESNSEFDDCYGVINYKNHLAFVDVSEVIMKYQLRLKDIFFFMGELEIADIEGYKTPLLKAKIILPANNINCFLYEKIVASLQNNNMASIK